MVTEVVVEYARELEALDELIVDDIVRLEELDEQALLKQEIS
jgi:hypothetical protein